MSVLGSNRGAGNLPGLVGKPRDLIGDIQARKRRKLLRRAAIIIAIAAALLAAGLVIRSYAQSLDAQQRLTAARQLYAQGTAADLDAAVLVLQEAIAVHPKHGGLRAALAVTLAHRVAEFGGDVQGAVSALGEAESAGASAEQRALAAALLAIAGDDVAAAEAAGKSRKDAEESPDAIAPRLWAWVDSRVAMAGHDPDRLAASRTQLETLLEHSAEDITLRRALISVRVAQGQVREALDELDRARKQSQLHTGLAADEALYNALLRQRLGGVASVSDQLLQRSDELSPLDLAHTRLARAVVHLLGAGEREECAALLREVWPALPRWDRVSRDLVLEMGVQAGAVEDVRTWLAATDLGDEERAIFEAWIVLEAGDVLDALTRLAALPQAHPRVAYLQGLALTEQGRWEEAAPWLTRADSLLPGRVELEVAKARADLRVGDRAAALRQLEGLAEEGFAPRAWTGIAEGRFLELDAPDLDAAARKKLEGRVRAALDKAIQREPLAARAHLLVGELALDGRGGRNPDWMAARAAFAAAAPRNDKLPLYRERLAAHYVALGRLAAADALYRQLVDALGAAPETPLLAAQVRLSRVDRGERRLDEAAVTALLDRAAENLPNAGAIATQRARIDVMSGDKARIEAARAAMTMAVDRDPKDVEARLVLLDAHAKQMDLENGVTIARRGIAAVEGVDSGRIFRAWARLESRATKWERAASLAKSAYQHMVEERRPPGEVVLAADDAVRYAIRNRKPKPVLSLGKAVTDRFGFHPSAWVARAEAELGAGLTAEARQSVDKAIELDPDHIRAHELRAQVLSRFGLRDQARESADRAQALQRALADETP